MTSSFRQEYTVEIITRGTPRPGGSAGDASLKRITFGTIREEAGTATGREEQFSESNGQIVVHVDGREPGDAVENQDGAIVPTRKQNMSTPDN